MADSTDTSDTGTPLERLRRYQEILSDFSNAVAETKLLGQMLHTACVQAARGMGIHHTKVMRHRPSMGDLIVEAGVGWKPGVVGHAKLGTDIASPPGRAIQTGTPVCITDLPNDQEFRTATVLREHGIVSLINAPVITDGVVWGVLEVDSQIIRHFSHDDITFLNTMATILGLAIQAKLLEKTAENSVTKVLREVDQQRTLLRELVHRNKNDFQMIMSILVMQRSKHPESNVQDAFRHVMDRVSAISMAHDQLAMRPDQPTIDMATYLRALCGNFRLLRDDVEVEAHLESAELTHERAVSLGLITNELVTNAIKYAFPTGKGTVRVEFTADPSAGQGCLIVADDGVGITSARPGSSGLHLVEGLARQIGGSVERIPVERGTRFRICFLLLR